MRVCLAIILLSLATGTAAHQFQTLAISLEELSGQRVTVLLKSTSGRNAQSAAVVPRLSPACVTLGAVHAEAVDDLILKTWQLQCDNAFADHELTVQGLGPAIPDAVISVRYADGSHRTEVLDRQTPVMFLGDRAAGTGVSSLFGYLPIGMEHILGGIDHLLFVLCLMLVIAATGFSWSRLLWTITAFTLAHSLTLALSTLYGMGLPSAAVEAVIALSIMLLTVELARNQRGPAITPGLSLRYPATVAFLFGLLHGLGFAGALSQVGLPEDAAVWALLFFNLGVELGQLLFVATVLGLFLATRDWLPGKPAMVMSSLVSAMGVVSAYWFFDRLTPVFLS